MSMGLAIAVRLLGGRVVLLQPPGPSWWVWALEQKYLYEASWRAVCAVASTCRQEGQGSSVRAAQPTSKHCGNRPRAALAALASSPSADVSLRALFASRAFCPSSAWHGRSGASAKARAGRGQRRRVAPGEGRVGAFACVAVRCAASLVAVMTQASGKDSMCERPARPRRSGFRSANRRVRPPRWAGERGAQEGRRVH